MMEPAHTPQTGRGPQRHGVPSEQSLLDGVERQASVAGVEDWIARWQRVARRIRVPLGFLAAALYLFELWRRAPQPTAVACSLALVVPGL